MTAFLHDFKLANSQCDIDGKDLFRPMKESCGLVMRNVLAEDHNEESTDSDDESTKLSDPEADGAPERKLIFVKLVPEPTSKDIVVTEASDISLDEDNEDVSSIVGGVGATEHDDDCSCETCTTQRAFVRDQVNKIWQWQSKGLKVRQYVRCVFNAAIESPCVPNIQKPECDPAEYAELQEIVSYLVHNHPHKFFLMLVMQAHEFVVELKIRIMRPLQGNKPIRTPEDKIIRPLEENNLARIAEIFLARLLNGYDILIATAIQVSELIKPLEEKHLSKFDLTWEFFNKKLYQNYIYFYEPTIRNILPSVVGQLRKPRRGKGYQILLERYLGFVDEMMRIAGLWPEKELLIDKYNSRQVNRIVEKFKKVKNWTLGTVQELLKIDAERAEDVPGLALNQVPLESYFVKWGGLEPVPDTLQVRKMLDDWGRESYQILARNCLGIHWYKPKHTKSKSYSPLESDFYFGYQVAGWLVLSRPSDGSMDVDTECTVCQDSAWVSHLVVGGRTKTGMCAHPTMKSNDEIIPVVEEPVDSQKLVVKTKGKACFCTYRHLGEWQGSTIRGLLAFPPCLCMLNMRRWAENVCPCVRDSTKLSRQSKPTDQVLTQTLTKEVSTDTKKITNSKIITQTQTRHSTTQTPSTPHNHSHQGRCPTHGHSHGSPGETVKSNAQTNKTLHNHNNHAGCHKQTNVEQIKRVQSCMNAASSATDENCSDSGSNDDSCSTGGTSSPRDNGRNCDCCYCEVFGHGVPSVAPVSRNYNETRERLRQLLNKKKATKCKSACSPPMSPAESVPSNANSESINSGPRSNTPVSVASTVPMDQHRDHRDLDALIEFIEGNKQQEMKQKNNTKKSEKKARQKQKKLDEVIKKQQQEAERLKIIELQKKTPEVTITVVDPQKPAPKRSVTNRNLPEVSILPASIPAVQKKPINNKKSGKQDVAVNNLETSKGNKNIRAISIDTNVSTKDHGKPIKGKNNKSNSKNNKLTIPSPPPPVAPVPVVSEPEIPLTKKQRQKLKREMKKMEEQMAKEQPKIVQQDNQPQIVTIKRVMESNCAEPTVTITLKGQTPAEDKVLFTLVNGQTKEPSKEQSQNPSGKKKKKKNQQQQQQQSITSTTNQSQKNVQQSKSQLNVPSKSQPVKTNEKNAKQQNNENKSKVGKKQEDIKQPLTSENKNTKSSKKDKKNVENKQPMQQTTTTKGKIQQQEVKTGKKQQNKTNVPTQPLSEIKVQSNVNSVNEPSGKKDKGQQQDNKSNQLGKNKSNNKQQAKTDNQKNQPKTSQPSSKQRPCVEPQKPPPTPPGQRFSSLGSQLKDASSKINIENLKLPPGITITKVDVPTKPLPIKSAPLQKPASVSKQATIIAAPMTGLQSNYGGSQSGGNVIVVDTGRLKQDLLPKNEKETSKEQQQVSTSNKKKKKKKNSGADVTNKNVNNHTARDQNEDHAKIVHNPGSNMVTIRNPAFGSAPKIEPLQQAAIIKLSDNGMVTIRSPALQQAINAGLTPPPKPDFIVKGDFMSANTSKTSTTITPSGHQGGNGIMTSSLAELRSRLTPDCTGITGLANIQISKVTNGQPIPENGINLKGTSVTLTKVRNPDTLTCPRPGDDCQPGATGKGKKKKKRGNGARACGDDWNLVESVFTPKDIDLEDGEMDDAERELEAFKRFCLQSVPPPRKEKVNLNLKDIVLKKKSSSSSSSSSSNAAIIAAN